MNGVTTMLDVIEHVVEKRKGIMLFLPFHPDKFPDTATFKEGLAAVALRFASMGIMPQVAIIEEFPEGAAGIVRANMWVTTSLDDEEDEEPDEVIPGYH